MCTDFNTPKEQLFSSAQTFCDDFATQKDITTLISHFSMTDQATAIEYGEPSLAPFLGRKFTGREEIKNYFEMIASLLSYEDMQFSEFIVDQDERKVAMKGRARFTWLSTGECWNETFAYILDFDEGYKVIRYQVWADTGAAYLASRGGLSEVMRTLCTCSGRYPCCRVDPE